MQFDSLLRLVPPILRRSREWSDSKAILLNCVKAHNFFGSLTVLLSFLINFFFENGLLEKKMLNLELLPFVFLETLIKFWELQFQHFLSNTNVKKGNKQCNYIADTVPSKGYGSI